MSKSKIFNNSYTNENYKVLIDNVLNQLDIIEIMEKLYNIKFEYINNDQFMACCPFPDHNDEDPSFSVNKTKKVFNCFGCGRKGNLLHFVMQIDNLSFKDALLKLSKLANIDYNNNEIDMLLKIKTINKIIDNYINIYNNCFPCNFTLDQFYNMIAIRTREYIKKVNYDENEIEWIEKFYKKLDELEENNEYKKMNMLWNKLNKQISERYNKWKQEHLNE